jgi:hypothetical protein
MMMNKYPGVPRAWMGCVSVRDVAEAHVRAITNERIDG